MPLWNVSKEESGLKLIEFLKVKLGNISTKQIKKALDSAHCSLNGRVEKFGSAIVGYGDRVGIEIIQKEKAAEGEVLYEDTDLMVFNKPYGITVEALQKKLKHRLVHRIDRDTSGALILAKSDEVFEKLVEQFKGKLVHKIYQALLDGKLKGQEGTVENYLGKVKEWEGQSLWGSVDADNGQLAITEWKVLKTAKDCTWVECKPITGRTHQIRVHMAGLGHPILGDKQYGQKFKCAYPALRTLLHAWKLEFTHPKTSKQIKITAPVPEDFQEAIQSLWGS